MGDEFEPRSANRGWLTFPASLAAVFCVLLVYSQTTAFTWDEGFHLLAAQSIRAGRLPYLDFCFPQTPLNAIWNALWMRLVGDTWRSAHALAAIESTLAVLLAADFVRRRFPEARWRLAGSVAAVLVLGLNPLVVQYATVGQAYAFCLLLTVAAFRCAVAAVEDSSPRLAPWAGGLSSAAAASSLLTVSVAPVLLIWILWRVPSRSRWKYFATFAGGAAVPFLPVLWLFAQSPKTVFFNLIQYQLLYRRTNWEDATPHDWKVLTSWLTSPGALVMGVLAIAGLWYIARRSAWKSSERAEFYLCGWLAIAMSAELCAAHPTFESYFVLITPFLAILAVAGLAALLPPNRHSVHAPPQRNQNAPPAHDSVRNQNATPAHDSICDPSQRNQSRDRKGAPPQCSISAAERNQNAPPPQCSISAAERNQNAKPPRAPLFDPRYSVAVLALVLAAGLAKSLSNAGNPLTWRDLEAVARKVNQVTPRGGTLWADEHVYFLTRRHPAEGTEFSYAEVIDLPENLAAPLHIKSDEDLDREAAEGKFDTVSTCEDREMIERLNLVKLFRQSAAISGCHVFWDPLRTPDVYKRQPSGTPADWIPRAPAVRPGKS